MGPASGAEALGITLCLVSQFGPKYELKCFAFCHPIHSDRVDVAIFSVDGPISARVPAEGIRPSVDDLDEFEKSEPLPSRRVNVQ